MEHKATATRYCRSPKTLTAEHRYQTKKIFKGLIWINRFIHITNRYGKHDCKKSNRFKTHIYLPRSKKRTQKSNILRLNAGQKRQRCQSSEQLLEFFRRDPNDFLSRLVTMDETWLYHYDLETKQQSMEWRHSGSPRPPQKNPSAKIRWKFFFWDQDGILLIDYLPKGQTINAEYCSSLLVQLKDILKGKRRGKVAKGGLVLARQCPGSPGTCNREETGLPGLPKSVGLFPGLKKQLKGRYFSSDEEVTAAAETWLDNFLNFFWVACKR